MRLEDRHVRRGDHPAAFGRAPLGDLDPAAVVEFNFSKSGIAARAGRIAADGEADELIHVLPPRARFDHSGLDGEKTAERLVAMDQTPETIKQHKGFWETLDGVLKSALSRQSAALGGAFIRYVQGDADDPLESAVHGRADALTTGVQPPGLAARRGDKPERDVERTLPGRAQHRLANHGSMILGNPRQGFIRGHHAATAPAHHQAHGVRHIKLVAVEGPLPHTAARRLHGGLEPLFSVGERLALALGPAVLENEQHAQGACGEERDHQSDDDIPERQQARTALGLRPRQPGEAEARVDRQHEKTDEDAQTHRIDATLRGVAGVAAFVVAPI